MSVPTENDVLDGASRIARELLSELRENAIFPRIDGDHLCIQRRAREIDSYVRHVSSPLVLTSMAAWLLMERWAGRRFA